MGSREFVLPEVIRLWDTLFADRKELIEQESFFHFLCLALVSQRRKQILQADFADVLRELQQVRRRCGCRECGWE